MDVSKATPKGNWELVLRNTVDRIDLDNNRAIESVRIDGVSV